MNTLSIWGSCWRVEEKGIEVDLDKAQTILEMPGPHTEKEVWGFLGRLNYIARFVSQLTATAQIATKKPSHGMEWRLSNNIR